MATIALTAIGGTLGPGGAFLGSMLGAYIDSSANWFGKKPEQKIGDIKLGTAEEGAPVVMVMGPQVRTGCEIIWKGEPLAVEQSSGGGCGGPSVPSTYGYFVDFSAAIGQPPPGFVVEAVEKIFLDGKVGWEFDPDITITSALLSVVTAGDRTIGSGAIIFIFNDGGFPIQIQTAQSIGGPLANRRMVISGVNGATNVNGTFTFSSGGMLGFYILGANGNGSAWTGGGTATVVEKLMRIQSPNGGPDLSVFRAGHDIVVSGYTGGSSVNNGTFSCVAATKDQATGISYVDLINPAYVAVVAGATVTLFQDLPQFSERYFAAITFHNGSQWQLPDSLIEAIEGVGNVSGNRGIAYLTFDDFNMTAFGDRLPNINTLCRVSTTWTVAQAITACLARAGFDSSDISVSTLTGTCLGFYVTGPVTPASCLASIMTTFNVVGYQVNETLFFVYRNAITATAIASTELVAHSPGSDAPRKARVRPIVDREVPREVQVHYQNPNRDYQGGMETAKRSGSRGDNVDSLETSITMTPGQAQDLARRIMWTGFANRHRLEIRLPPSRLQIHEGQVLQFTEQGRTWNLLAQKIDLQQDGSIVIEGPNDEAAALDFSGSPADGGADDSGGPGVLQALDLSIIDIAPLSDSHVSDPGVYAVSAPVDQTHIWIGAELFESTQDVDGTFTSAVSLPRAARMGRSASTLGSATPFMIDYTNTVDVLLTFGPSLEGTTEADMLGGKNRAVLGGEVIGFTTATLIGTHTWRLGGLLRGLRDTDQSIGFHATNERFIMLTPATGVTFFPQSIGLLNASRFYRSVPIGGNVDDYPTVPEVYDAATVTPFTVFDIRGARLASDATPDVVVTWTRQTRSNVGPFTPSPIPLNESRELYEIDLMDKATGGVIQLTKQVTTATATFTDAEITGLGYTSGDLIKVRVYQIGDFVGRGRMRAATV